MERRGCSLGCIITALGLLLSCCLLPYLVSSIYSIITALLQVPAAPDWLWGDWINTIAGENNTLYMLLAEGPICCVGTIGLLFVILGLVLAISGAGGPARPPAAPVEEYEAYPDTGDQESSYY